MPAEARSEVPTVRADSKVISTPPMPIMMITPVDTRRRRVTFVTRPRARALSSASRSSRSTIATSMATDNRSAVIVASTMANTRTTWVKGVTNPSGSRVKGRPTRMAPRTAVDRAGHLHRAVASTANRSDRPKRNSVRTPAKYRIAVPTIEAPSTARL